MLLECHDVWYEEWMLKIVFNIIQRSVANFNFEVKKYLFLLHFIFQESIVLYKQFFIIPIILSNFPPHQGATTYTEFPLDIFC